MPITSYMEVLQKNASILDVINQSDNKVTINIAANAEILLNDININSLKIKDQYNNLTDVTADFYISEIKKISSNGSKNEYEISLTAKNKIPEGSYNFAIDLLFFDRSYVFLKNIIATSEAIKSTIANSVNLNNVSQENFIVISDSDIAKTDKQYNIINMFEENPTVGIGTKKNAPAIILNNSAETVQVTISNTVNNENQAISWNDFAQDVIIRNSHYKDIEFLISDQDYSRTLGQIHGGDGGAEISYIDYSTANKLNNNVLSIYDNVSSYNQKGKNIMSNIKSISMGVGDDILDISSNVNFVGYNDKIDINLGEGDDILFSGGVSGTVNVQTGTGYDKIYCAQNTEEIIKYNSISHSSSTSYDIIFHFDATKDKIDLTNFSGVLASNIIIEKLTENVSALYIQNTSFEVLFEDVINESFTTDNIIFAS